MYLSFQSVYFLLCRHCIVGLYIFHFYVFFKLNALKETEFELPRTDLNNTALVNEPDVQTAGQDVS